MLSILFVLAMLAGLAFGLGVLFLPALVARFRHHPNALAIFLVNLFFGWTFVGWIVSLIWACTRPLPQMLYAPAGMVVAHPQCLALGDRPAANLPGPASYQGSR